MLTDSILNIHLISLVSNKILENYTILKSCFVALLIRKASFLYTLIIHTFHVYNKNK